MIKEGFQERSLQLTVQNGVLESKHNKKVVWKYFNEIIIPPQTAALKGRDSDLAKLWCLSKHEHLAGIIQKKKYPQLLGTNAIAQCR